MKHFLEIEVTLHKLFFFSPNFFIIYLKLWLTKWVQLRNEEALFFFFTCKVYKKKDAIICTIRITNLTFSTPSLDSTDSSGLHSLYLSITGRDLVHAYAQYRMGELNPLQRSMFTFIGFFIQKITQPLFQNDGHIWYFGQGSMANTSKVSVDIQPSTINVTF